MRRAFDARPAFAEVHFYSWLPDPDELRREIRAAGREVRPFADAIREADEAADYARAALDARAWDAAAVELDRVIDALVRIATALGLPPTSGSRRVGRRAVADALGAIFDRSHRANVLRAWRRLDLALAALAQARRPASDPEARRTRLVRTVEAFAHPRLLRDAYRLGPVHRDVRREILRLFDEGQEAAEYALASLDGRAWVAAETDLERLDAALRALRHIVQRESPVYLPEPWPLRLPARLTTARAMEREALERRAGLTIADAG